MRSRVGIALAAAVLAASPPAAFRAAAQVAPLVAEMPRMTIEEAVDHALAYSPQLAQSEQQILQAAESQRLAYGSFLPSLSMSAGSSLRSSNRFDPATDRVVSGSADSYNAGLSARYELFTGGRRFAELNETRANLSAAEARRVDQRFAVVLTTRSLFLQALRQEELLAVAQARVDQAEQSLAMTRRQAQVGSATSSDTLRARLEAINASQTLLQAETSLHNARTSLGRQVGVAGPVDAEAPAGGAAVEPLTLEPEAILSLAEDASPTVVAAEAAANAAAAGVRAARTQYLPSVSVSSGYSWANQDLALGDDNTSWSLGASLSYPLFNGFQRESNVVRAKASQDVAVLQARDARLAARQEADAALRDLTTAERAVEIAEQAVLVAEEDLRVVRERYRVGVARIFDVITSQVALDQARVDLVQARYDYLLARAELEAIVGREL